MNCKCPRISSPPLKALSFGGPLLIADPARYLMEGEASDGSRFATDCCNMETSLFWAFRTGCSVVLVTLPSQARAVCQSRVTVTGETPSAPASRFQPPRRRKMTARRLAHPDR
jgi:hypothetical protein